MPPTKDVMKGVWHKISNMLFSSRTLLPALLLAASLASAQQIHRIDDVALKNAGKSGDEWLSYGLDQGETRFSPLTQINPPTWVV